MNHELIKKEDKAIVVTDKGNVDVANSPKLPEYLELQNLEEYLVSEINGLKNDNIKAKVDKIASFYHKIFKTVWKVGGIIGTCLMIIYYIKALLNSAVSSWVTPSIAPFLAMSGMVALTALKDRITKTYGCKNILEKFLTTLNERDVEKLEKDLELVRGKLLGIEATNTFEKNAERLNVENNEDVELTQAPNLEQLEEKIETISFERMNLEKSREILKILQQQRGINKFSYENVNDDTRGRGV